MQIKPINRKSFSPLIRYPFLILAYTIGQPLRWLAEKTGLIHRLLRKIGLNTPMRTTMLGAFEGYTPTEHDVFVCAYSKSGTNWTMQIAYEITMCGEGNFEHIHDVVAWPDGPPGFSTDLKDDTVWQVAPTNLRVIKTHLSFQYLSYNQKARYIWVVRNPKEVFVSTYFFSQDVVFGPLMPSLLAWLHAFTSDAFPFNDWPENLSSYWPVRDRDNVLLLYYHNMIKDLPATVRKIADFLNVELTPTEFETVCHKSGFKYMKGINHKFYTSGLTPLANPNGKMIRKGKSGNSKELLTPEQQQAIDVYCKAELKRLKCDFPYDEIFATTKKIS